MEWSREEMERLYVEAQKKAATDEGFRKEILADATAALEKLAGKKLPEGMKLKAIENDPAYTATFVLPNMLSEEVSMEDLDKAAGGAAGSIVGRCFIDLPDPPPAIA